MNQQIERKREITDGDMDKAMVVAQLVEQLLPTPEIRGSNPVIVKFYLPS